MRKLLLVLFCTLVPAVAHAGVLYMIDTGVNLPGVVDGPDFTGGDGRDCHGHGTAMAIITEVPASSIISVRTLNCWNNAQNAHIEAAMQWVWDDFVGGGYRPSAVLMAINATVGHPAWDAIIQDSTGDGLLWVVPAGNHATWTFWGSPQRVDAALVVAGSLGTTPAWFSSYGPQVDVWAEASTPRSQAVRWECRCSEPSWLRACSAAWRPNIS